MSDLKLNRLSLLLIFALAVVFLSISTASAFGFAFDTESPDEDVDLSATGDTYVYQVDVSEVDEIDGVEVDIFYEWEEDPGQQFNTYRQEYYVDGQFIDDEDITIRFNEVGETGEETIATELDADVSDRDTIEFKIEVDRGIDQDGGVVTFRTSDEARLYQEVSVLSSPEPDDTRESSPVQLAVDLDGKDADVEFRDSDGDLIATESGEEGSTVTTEWAFDDDDIDDEGNVKWSAETEDDMVEASFTGLTESTEPIISNPNPEDGSTVFESPVTVSVDIEDEDFETVQGDEVEVSIINENDGSELTTETITDPSEVSATFEDTVAGTNEWSVTAIDDYGNSVNRSFTFEAPDELQIRNETDPDSLVTTDAEVEVQFFAGDEVITRSTDDGVVDLEGLPADQAMTIQVVADGYITRQSVVESILDQQDVYLLPDDVDSVETTFLLDDRTGEFPRDRTRIIVEKPITRDGETTYQTVVSDQSGPSGYSTVLERDSRYRLAIINEETEQRRVLGPYVTTSSETVNLEVDEVQFDSGGTDIGYEWRADYINESSPSVRFDFQAEPDREIRDFELRITSRDGETELINESYGTVDSVSETVAIPDDIEDPESQTWEVEWTAETDDGDEVTPISGGEIVGPDQMPVELPGVTDDVLHVVSVLIILLVAGLFSSANVTVGGVVTSLTAGGLWFVGATPPGVTGMFVATGLFVSIIAHLRTNQQVRPA